MLALTTRRRDIISGLIALVLLTGAIVIGVSQAVGEPQPSNRPRVSASRSA